MPQNPLGRSLLLDDGDLVLQQGRLVEVEGRPNLAQALRLRVLTPWGSDPFNVAYGFDFRAVMAQAGGAQAVRDVIRLNLVRVLTADPRVLELRDVEFEAVEGSQRRAWTVRVSFVAADGRAQTLTTTVGV